MPDEDIVLTLTVQASQFISEAQKAEAEVQKMVLLIKEVAAQAESSFTVAGNSIRDKLNESLKSVRAEIDALSSKIESGFAGPETVAKKVKLEGREKEIEDELKSIGEAQRRVNAQAIESVQQQRALRKQQTAEVVAGIKQESAAAKAVAKSRSADIQQIIRLEKEAIASQKKSQDEIGRVAKSYYADRRADIQTNLKLEAAAARQQATQQKEINNLRSVAAKAITQQAKLDIPFPVDKIKSDIKSIADQAGVSFKQAAQHMKEAFAKSRQVVLPSGAKAWASPEAKAEFGAYSKSVNEGLKSLQSGAKTTGSSFSALTGIVGGLAASLGFSLIGALQAAIGYLKDAAKAGYDFAKAMFQLQVGINAMRRSGIDITTQDMMENIQKLRNEFRMFSEQELVMGAAELVNLSRDFGMTKEAIFELQDAVVKLAVVNGRAMDDVQRTVALALSSGYTEGLQRLGVSINRVTIAEKAKTLGYADSYNALTEVQRAEATRIIILEKTAKYEEDLAKYNEQLPASIDSATASFNDMTKTIGGLLLPLWAGLMEVLGGASNFFTRFFGETIPKLVSKAAEPFIKFGNVVVQTFEIIRQQREGFDFEEIAENVAKGRKFLEQALTGQLPVPEAPIAPKLDETYTDEQVDAYEKSLKSFYEMEQEYGEKLTDLREDLMNDLIKIDKEHANRDTEIWKEWEEEVAKINADAAKEVEEANRELGYDIEDLNRETAQKIEDANRKYREEELKEERDYQEKLRRLREEFLYDLEDALRERDALQVLRLIRRYKLDLEQLQRQHEQESQERRESYQNELEDIQRQRERKLEELRIEHQRRLEEIERQRILEQEEAIKKRDEEREANAKEWQAAREARLAEYELSKEELKTWLQDQLNTMIESFKNMQGVTDQMVANLSQAFVSLFGQGGTIDVTLSNFKSMLAVAAQEAVNKASTISSALSSLNSTMATLNSLTAVPAPVPGSGGVAIPNPNPNINYPQVPKYASGGSFVSTRPNLFMAGEVPELINVTPLNQLSSKGDQIGSTGGSAEIQVSLSPGLQAEIVDNALSAVALEINRGMRGR